VENVAPTGIKILENTHSENNVLPKMNYSQKKKKLTKGYFFGSNTCTTSCSF
jgi:hypothetical protein